MTGSSDYSTVANVELVTGIEEQFQEQIKIYSTQSEVIVKVGQDILKPLTLNIYDLSGQMIYEGYIKSQESHINIPINSE